MVGYIRTLEHNKGLIHIETNMDTIRQLEEKIMVAERMNDSLASRTNQTSTATEGGSEKTIPRPPTPADNKEQVNAWQKEMWRMGSPNFSIENHGNLRYGRRCSSS
eukprot:TRINITY_DN4039_c0_g1_i18.p2 TRINITY_DN4039_c0_g1~~TRINITY_DN4039_c0_g1_i18.p2  ORF type:complete len:106 (-),score=9.45 TRINITY_DN4039_c0_g1_i18:520-837(-)